MQTKLLTLLSFFLYCTLSLASNDIPINDTIQLKLDHVRGRWIETKKDSEKSDIYIFREDYTFHKATDSGEILFFNVAGKYQLSNDSIKIFYQDFSRQTTRAVKVKKMHLQVISLSDQELNINKTENYHTQFIRLRRQNAQ